MVDKKEMLEIRKYTEPIDNNISCETLNLLFFLIELYW